MSRDIDALNDEMKAAPVRIFIGGLSPARSARSLQAQPAGKVLVTDGPLVVRTSGPRQLVRVADNSRRNQLEFAVVSVWRCFTSGQQQSSSHLHPTRCSHSTYRR